LEELRRELERDLARDLEAVFGARRMVDLLLVRAFDVFRLVEVFRAEVDFFRLAFLCPELFPELFDAAPIKAPDNAPVTAPASARLKTPPVFLSARFAVATAVSCAALAVNCLFLFAMCVTPTRGVRECFGADKRGLARQQPPHLQLPTTPGHAHRYQ
jgi:hypothetical protein